MRFLDIFKPKSNGKAQFVEPQDHEPPEKEQRSWTLTAFPDWLLTWLGVESIDGLPMSAENALKYSAVYACVDVISKDLASLPFHVFRRRDGGGREVAYNHPVYSMVHSIPNSLSTSIVFRETLQAHVLLTGNAYAQIIRNDNQRPIYFKILNPDDVEPVESGGDIFYRVKGMDTALASYEMLHIPGLGFNGITGKSVIKYASESIDLGIQAQRQGLNTMKNGARLRGVFETEGSIDKPGQDRLEKSFEEKYTGPNRKEVAILPRGLRYKPIQMSQEDAQYVETRNLQVPDISRWFRVPPHMIGHLDKATFSNIEHQSIEYVTRTLRSWIVRWEQEYNRKLLGGSGEFYTEMNIEGLLRGDSAARATFYREMFNIGVLSQNMILEKENMNPIVGGDTHYVNGAMIPVDRMNDIIDARIRENQNIQNGQD